MIDFNNIISLLMKEDINYDLFYKERYIARNIFQISDEIIEKYRKKSFHNNTNKSDYQYVLYRISLLRGSIPLIISSLLNSQLIVRSNNKIKSISGSSYKLKIPTSYELLYACLRDSDEFNKSIIENLEQISKNKKFYKYKVEIVSSIKNWTQNSGFEDISLLSDISFYEKDLKEKISYFLSKIYHRLRRDISIKVSYLISRIKNPLFILKNSIFITTIPHISNLFSRELSIPFSLKFNLPDLKKKQINHQIDFKERDLIALIIKETLAKNTQILNYTSISQIKAISLIASRLIPLSLLENSESLYKFTNDFYTKNKNVDLSNLKNLITYATSGSDQIINLISYFHSKDIKIISFAHSSISGYLKDSAVVSSFSIYDSDIYYHYSSKKHPDKFFKDYIFKTIPSLQYSHFNKFWKSKQFFNLSSNFLNRKFRLSSKKKDKKKILIVMMEKYPYTPLFQGLKGNSIPLKEYILNISNLAIKLCLKGFDVYLKPYNTQICSRYNSYFIDLIAKGVNVLEPSRYRLGYVLNMFDFFIFDMISSAFFEAVISKKNYRLYIHPDDVNAYVSDSNFEFFLESNLVHDNISDLINSFEIADEFSNSEAYKSARAYVNSHSLYNVNLEIIKDKWRKILLSEKFY
tara:strand:- start:1378 stop:3285 length:1908 start_codon:yes stop_codon:yes gene_type:complete